MDDGGAAGCDARGWRQQWLLQGSVLEMNDSSTVVESTVPGTVGD